MQSDTGLVNSFLSGSPRHLQRSEWLSISEGGVSYFYGSFQARWARNSGTYTLKLSSPQGQGLLGEVEPGQALTDIKAEVFCNGELQPHITVALTAKVAPQSGGHQHHDANRPTGSVPQTVGSGDAFTFGAPPVSGDHTIEAKCASVECGVATGDVWVGVKGLVELPDVISLAPWVKVGQQAEHPNNHYLKPEAIIKLIQFASYYSETFPNDPPLHLNDASLERGGVFDIRFDWMRPHGEHRRGVVIDVRANGTPTAIPKKNFKKFEALMSDLDIEWLREHVNQSNGHYHLRLLRIAQ